MIIAHLSGGLGNQLFQYAMARQIANDRSAELRLDLFSYRSDRLRAYGLDAFRIRALPASWADVFRLCPVMAFSRLAPRPLYERGWRFLKKLGLQPLCRSRAGEPGAPQRPLFHGHVMAERQTTFDHEAGQCPDHRLIVGNWPNERYFKKMRPQLLQELQHKLPPSSRDQELLGRMKSGESIAVHVRRGDKVGNPTFKATSAEYCHRAMEEARRRLRQPQFYLFSDDPAWAASHVARDADAVIIDHHPQDQVHADFRLMRACKHQIIASSSLSWWAAWLNENPVKVVITPPACQWVQRPGCDPGEILPPEWTVVEAEAD